MRLYHIFKRGMDIFVSLSGIIVLLPLWIIIAIIIKLTSKGPVVYTHPRMARYCNEFDMYKFRTMVVGAKDLQRRGVSVSKLITPFGKFLRRTFLDETLQLINILKGDMSIVGPRPMDVEYFQSLVKDDRVWCHIFAIKPGLTGLESVADYLPREDRLRFEEIFKGLPKEEPKEGFLKHRFILDSYYVENESFVIDTIIFFCTIWLILKRIVSGKQKVSVYNKKVSKQ